MTLYETIVLSWNAHLEKVAEGRRLEIKAMRAVKELAELQRAHNAAAKAPISGLNPVDNRRFVSIKVPVTLKSEQVWRELASDKTNRQVSEVLNLSEKAVRGQRLRLYKKLNVQGLAGLTRAAIKRGLITA